MRIVLLADSIDLQSAGIHVYTLNMVRSLEESGRHEIFCVRTGTREDLVFRNDVRVKALFPFLKVNRQFQL